MKHRKLLAYGLAVLLSTLVYSILVYPRLPDSIATHFNLQGQPDQYSSKFWGLAIAPFMQAFMLVLFLLLPILSPSKARLDSFSETYNKTCVYVLIFLGFVQVVIAESSLRSIDVTKWILCGVFLLIGLIGNLLAKTRRNYWMGIRTPWTLESEEVWNRTHRFGARTMVFGSVTGLFLTLTGMPVLIGFSVLMVSCLAPVLYSYFIYKKLRLG